MKMCFTGNLLSLMKEEKQYGEVHPEKLINKIKIIYGNIN